MADQNPFETPRPRGVRFLQAVLRVVVSLECFGLGAQHLVLHQPDLFCQLIGKARDLPADQIANISDVAAYALLACGVLNLLRPTNLILMLLVVHQLGSAVAVLIDPVPQHPVLSIALRATQFTAPLALLLVDFWPPRIKATLVMCLGAMTLLKLATVATFIAQGTVYVSEARLGGPSLEMFEAAFSKGIRESFTTEEARNLLTAYAMLEIGLAISLMCTRSKMVMFSSAAVGFASALVPTLADNTQGWSQSLVQLTLAGGPLAMLVFHITSIKEQRPIYLAETKAATPPSAG